ncbi:MAG: DUF6049 family protein, partial [Rhodoglobus sp.]
MSMRLSRAALLVGLGLASAVALLPPAPAVAVGGPTHLALVMPLVAPANSTGLISAEALELYTAPGGVLTRELAAVIDTPVTIGIDPMLIASIRVLGAAAPESAIAWLERLGAATNDTFALGYADTDLTLAIQAGATAVPEPDGFEFAIDPALLAPAPGGTQTPEPTASADPGEPRLATSEELLAWPYTLPAIAWPRAGTVSASDLAIIARNGYATTLVSSGNVTGVRGATGKVDGASILIADDAVSAALRDAATGAVPVAAVTAAATANDTGLVLAAMDRVPPVSSSVLSEVVAALTLDPAITLVSIREAIALTPVAATIAEQPQSAERLARAGSLLTAEAADARFASIVETPGLIRGERRLALLAMLSNAWAANPVGWTRASDSFLADSIELRDSVQVAEIAGLLLVADSSQYLPVNVDNTLDQAVTVYVTLRPTTAVLAVLERRVQIVVPPASQVRVDVPVQSLTNGTVDFVV